MAALLSEASASCYLDVMRHLISLITSLMIPVLTRITVAIFFTMALGGAAWADGIPAYLDTTGWHLLSEEVQEAMISTRKTRDGIVETMLLGVRVAKGATPAEAKKLVWITPIPAAGASVKVDVLRGFPRLYGGQRPFPALVSHLQGGLALASATQIYPIPVGLVMVVGGGGKGALTDALHVVQKIRRHGVEVELLAAPSREALAAHLARRDIQLPAPALDALKGYFSPKASLVLFRIADLQRYREASKGAEAHGLGVEVTFPTEEGFFPLVASSVLPGARLDVVVTVLDHVRSVAPAPAGLMTEHYVGWIDGPAETLRVLRGDGGGVHRKLRYTRMKISGPPSALRHDLRFRPGASARTSAASAILLSPYSGWLVFVVTLGYFLLASFFAAFMARQVWPAEHRPSRRATFFLALANLLTLVAVLIAAARIGRRLGAPRGRGALYALIQSVILSALLGGAAWGVALL
ncbi:MAG: hypothetical protein KAI47_18930 [Deltaproteobacteria bacterium]|nr:hypothetical protein [Deltaproteobacteria bacterium]